MKNPKEINSISVEDFNGNSYGKYSELFKIAKDFPNLKYPGLPKKDNKQAVGFGYRVPNPDHIKIKTDKKSQNRQIWGKSVVEIYI